MTKSHAKLEITKETSMERFGNASHDDIQKLMDKSKNKKTTKAKATWMDMYHTCISHLYVYRTCARAI